MRIASVQRYQGKNDVGNTVIERNCEYIENNLQTSLKSVVQPLIGTRNKTEQVLPDIDCRNENWRWHDSRKTLTKCLSSLQSKLKKTVEATVWELQVSHINSSNGFTIAIFEVPKKVLNKGIRCSWASTVTEAQIQGLVPTKLGTDIISQRVLCNTGINFIIAETMGASMARAVA